MHNTVPDKKPSTLLHVGMTGRGICITEALHAFADKRVRSTLGRFASRIVEVNVRLNNVPAEQRGAKRSCHIVVRLKRVPCLAVSACHENVYAAIALAAKRAEVAVKGLMRPSQWARTPTQRYDWASAINELDRDGMKRHARRRRALRKAAIEGALQDAC